MFKPIFVVKHKSRTIENILFILFIILYYGCANYTQEDKLPLTVCIVCLTDKKPFEQSSHLFR